MLKIGECIINIEKKTGCCKKCGKITEHEIFLFSDGDNDVIIDNCIRCNLHIRI